MKSFRFPLQTLLDLRNAEVEVAQAARQQLRGRRESSERRAEQLAREAERIRSNSLGQATEITGASLRATEMWMQRLEMDRAAAVEAIRRLGLELENATKALVAKQREVDGLEKLRDRQRRNFEREQDKREQQLIEDLMQARRAGRR